MSERGGWREGKSIKEMECTHHLLKLWNCDSGDWSLKRWREQSREHLLFLFLCVLLTHLHAIAWMSAGWARHDKSDGHTRGGQEKMWKNVTSGRMRRMKLPPSLSLVSPSPSLHSQCPHMSISSWVINYNWRRREGPNKLSLLCNACQLIFNWKSPISNSCRNLPFLSILKENRRYYSFIKSFFFLLPLGQCKIFMKKHFASSFVLFSPHFFWYLIQVLHLTISSL